jgi:hypothetical protein
LELFGNSKERAEKVADSAITNGGDGGNGLTRSNEETENERIYRSLLFDPRKIFTPFLRCSV